MRRLLSIVLTAAILLTMMPALAVRTSAATDFPEGLYLTQAGKTTCTLCSTAMMLRARMYLSGNTKWAHVTESGIKSTAWIDGTGLRWTFTYQIDGNSMTVSNQGLSGISVSNLKAVLDNHPEGIALYCGNAPHAVFLTDYEGDTFYCADPYSGYSGARIPLENSWLGDVYGSQATILKRVTAYWYVSSYSITDNRNDPPEPCDCVTDYAGTYICTTTSDFDLNIRSGHGTSYRIIGTIPSGETVTVTKASGDSTSDWAHITYKGIEGFASMGYLMKLDVEPEQEPADLGTAFYAMILSSSHEKPISADPDGLVRLQSKDGSAKQLWRFDRQEDGSYLITSASTGFALEMSVDEAGNGTQAAAQSEDQELASQRWFLYQQGSGYVLQSAQSGEEKTTLTLAGDDPADGTAIVAEQRTNDSSQIWTIYREEAPLATPMLTVDAGRCDGQTVFAWNDVNGENGYNLKIWMGTDREGTPDYDISDATSGWSIQLPLGSYVAYVEAYHHYGSEMSNVLMFTVAEQQHTYDDWQITQAPTCTQEGQQQRCCSVCGAVETQTLDPLQHAYTAEVTAPTCTQAGFTTYTCQHCADQYTADFVDATGHHYVDGTCEHCGAAENELGDVNGDGFVDTTDAKLIMQCDLGMIDADGMNLSVADVNGDGAVDTTDAKLIMQKDLGMISQFP